MKITIYTRKDRQRDNGMIPVYLRIKPYNKNQFLIYSGIDCINEPNGFVFPKNEPNGKSKGIALMEKYTACENIILKGKDKPLLKLKEELTSAITGKEKSYTSIKTMFKKFCEGKYEGTRKMYERTLSKIETFDPNADFGTIDRKWLERFETYLEKDGANVNGISLHMRNLRAVFNYAIDEEVTQNYPFRKYKIKSEQSRKRDLTPEQVRTLRDYPCNEFQEIYRDLFMLIIYLCGINIGDLLMLKNENIANGRIEYYRRKTKKYYSIKIEPEAQKIIDKYKGVNWLLSPLDSYGDYHDFMAHMNRNMKQIGMVHRHGAKTTGTALFPNISTYYARHTWASIAAEIDIPMDVIAQALGHSTPYTTTDIYVNRRLKKIDEANRKVIDFLNGIS